MYRVFLLSVVAGCTTVTAASLDRPTALSRFLAVAPEAAVARAAVEGARARCVAARTTTAPELELEIEHPGHDDEEMTLSWSRDLEPRRRRSLTIAAAEEELAVERATQQAALIDGLDAVSRAFYDTVTRDGEHELAAEQQSLVDELLPVARRRVRAGAAPGLEEERASIEHAAATIAHRRAEQAAATARERLAMLLDWPVERTTDLTVALGADTPLPSFDEAVALLSTGHPLLVAAARGASAAALVQRSTRERNRTVWRSTVGVRHIRASSDRAVVLGMAVPLGTGRRNRGALLEAAAVAARRRNEQAALQRSLERALQTALADARQAHAELSAVGSDVLPRAERVFNAVKEGYVRGELTYPDLLEARRALVVAGQTRLKALNDYRRSLLDVERALGGSEATRAAIQEVIP